MSYKIPKIQVKAGQTLFDLAIQEYGTVEGMYLLLLANSNSIEGITADLDPGQELLVWPVHVLQEFIEREEAALAYAGLIMNWLVRIGLSSTGSGSVNGGGSEWNDSDYVHIRGDEVIAGIKRFLSPIKVDKILPGGKDGVDLNGLYIAEGIIDMGRIDYE